MTSREVETRNSQNNKNENATNQKINLSTSVKKRMNFFLHSSFMQIKIKFEIRII